MLPLDAALITARVMDGSAYPMPTAPRAMPQSRKRRPSGDHR